VRFFRAVAGLLMCLAVVLLVGPLVINRLREEGEDLQSWTDVETGGADAPPTPTTTQVQLSRRSEAAEWIARRADETRLNLDVREPILLELPGPESDPEAREFLRELKLALAHQGLSYETQDAGSGDQGPLGSRIRLRIEASRAGRLRTVEIKVQASEGEWEWCVEYPH
jgi:hypothetical protein